MFILGVACLFGLGYSLINKLKRTKTSLIIEIIFHNFKIKGSIMATQIPLKDFAKTIFKIRNDEDGSILNTVANAIVFTGETFVSADETIATVKVDAEDTPDTAILDVQAVGVGTTSIKFDVDASYIDPKVLAANPGVDPSTLPKVNKHFAAMIEATVPPNETGTSLVVELGEPQPIPEL